MGYKGPGDLLAQWHDEDRNDEQIRLAEEEADWMMSRPQPCEHDTQGSEQPDTCDHCAYLKKKYGDTQPWEDATWD